MVVRGICIFINRGILPPSEKQKGSDGQRLFYGNKGLIYPDFIGKDNKNRLIADAKYKPESNIAGKDYLQVLAYMFRFDARCGYYLYPKAEGQADNPIFEQRDNI